MSRVFTPGLAVFALALVAFALCANSIWATDHATSFIQLDYSILHDHSFALTSATATPPWSVDDFLYRGQNYSALAPGAALLALPFEAVGFYAAGGYTAYGQVLITSALFVSITGALAAYLVYALASLRFRRSTSLLLGFAFAFSTIAWPMATVFFQSDPSALFVLLAAYLAVRAVRKDRPTATAAALSGLAAGAAFTVDYVNGIIIPLLALYFLLGARGRLNGARCAAALLAGAVPGLSVIGYYNYTIFGSPLVGTEQSYLHVSSVLGSFTTSPVYGLALDTVSLARGLLVFAPFLVLGAVGFIEALRREGDRKEPLLILALFLSILLPYSMWYEPFGGLSYGPRFLVAAIPFLLLPAGYVIERARGWRMWLVYGLYVVGAAMNGIAAVVGAIPVTKGFDDSPFASVILPEFLRGTSDTFWGYGSPYALPLALALVASLGVAVPILAVELQRRREKPESRAQGDAFTNVMKNGAAVDKDEPPVQN